jgi:hypothetical protein
MAQQTFDSLNIPSKATFKFRVGSFVFGILVAIFLTFWVFILGPVLLFGPLVFSEFIYALFGPLSIPAWLPLSKFISSILWFSSVFIPPLVFIVSSILIIRTSRIKAPYLLIGFLVAAVPIFIFGVIITTLDITVRCYTGPIGTYGMLGGGGVCHSRLKEESFPGHSQSIQSSPQVASTPYRLAYIDGNNHVIFDRKDLGDFGLNNGHDNFHSLTVSGESILWEKSFPEKYKEDHLIFNGKDFGESWEFVTNGKDIYQGKINSNRPDYSGDLDLFKNGKKVGVTSGLKTGGFQSLVVNDKHDAFINDEDHIIYDGKDLGEGYDVLISGDNILYTPSSEEEFADKEIRYNGTLVGLAKFDGYIALSGNNYVFVDQNKHIIYNGRDMGLGSGDDFDTPLALSDKHFAYFHRTQLNKPYEYRLFLDDKDIGDICNGNYDNIEPFLKFINNKLVASCGKEIFIDGKRIGEGDAESVQIEGDNMVYEKPIDDKMYSKEVIYNNKTISQLTSGATVKLSDDYILITDEDGFSNIFHGGIIIAQGYNASILSEHIAYSTTVDGKDHIILDGKDIGAGTRPILSK